MSVDADDGFADEARVGVAALDGVISYDVSRIIFPIGHNEVVVRAVRWRNIARVAVLSGGEAEKQAKYLV